MMSLPLQSGYGVLVKDNPLARSHVARLSDRGFEPKSDSRGPCSLLVMPFQLLGDEACNGLELYSLSTWDRQAEPGNRRSLHGSIN